METAPKSHICFWHQGRESQALRLYTLCKTQFDCVVDAYPYKEEELQQSIKEISLNYDIIIISAQTEVETHRIVKTVQTEPLLKRKPLVVVQNKGQDFSTLFQVACQENWRFQTLDTFSHDTDFIEDEVKTKMWRAIQFDEALKQLKQVVPYQESLIMATDDMVTNLLVLKYILKDNYKIHTVELSKDTPHKCNDKRLFELIETKPVQMLLTSGHRYPQRDGFQLTYEISHGHKGRQVPCMFLCAWYKSNTAEAAYRSGAIDYLEVPYDKNELEVRLRTHLEMSSIIDNTAITPRAEFIIDDNTKVVKANNVTILDKTDGHYIGEGMAAFTGKSILFCERNYFFLIANTISGKFRLFCEKGGALYLKSEEKYDDTVSSGYIRNIEEFYGGLCTLALTPSSSSVLQRRDYWNLSEESLVNNTVYALINSDLEVVIPFLPLEAFQEAYNNYR